MDALLPLSFKQCHPGLEQQFSCFCLPVFMRSQQGATYSRLREYLFCSDVWNKETLPHASAKYDVVDKIPHSRPGITKRQRRRRYEDVYWTNVHVNAIKSRTRRLKRMDKAADAIFDEYAELVAQERLHCLLDAKKVLHFSAPVSVYVTMSWLPSGPREKAQPARGKLSDFKLPMLCSCSDGMLFSGSLFKFFVRTILQTQVNAGGVGILDRTLWKLINTNNYQPGNSNHPQKGHHWIKGSWKIVDECNPRKKASVEMPFKDTCLVDAFRSIGIKVPYTGPGPFWAVSDGAKMLEPLGQLGGHWSMLSGLFSRAMQVCLIVVPASGILLLCSG